VHAFAASWRQVKLRIRAQAHYHLAMIKRRGNRPLAVGIQLPEVERVVRWAEVQAMAISADRLGFDSLWVGDHLIYRHDDGQGTGPWEAWSSLAAIAAVTKTIRIGPLVAATGFHNPTILAKKAAAIDEISDGRLVLGLGAGWNKTEYHAFGLAFDHRVSRFAEAFDIIRRLLRSETVDYKGKFYNAQSCELFPKTKNPEGPPLLIGSIGPRVLRITLPHVQQWNAWYAWFGNSPEGLKPHLAQLDRACAAVGRDPHTLARTVSLLVRAPKGIGRLTGRDSASGNESPDIPISGSPREVARSIAQFASLGIAEVQLVVDPITQESIEWCAQALEVLDTSYD